MTDKELEAATMLKQILEAQKENPSTLMHSIILGYCVGIMAVYKPEELDPTIRQCVGSAYLKANEHVAPELGIDDFIEYVLEL